MSTSRIGRHRQDVLGEMPKFDSTTFPFLSTSFCLPSWMFLLLMEGRTIKSTFMTLFLLLLHQLACGGPEPYTCYLSLLSILGSL
jgi:hypothetical protein